MDNIKPKLVMACLKKQDLQREYELLKEKSETIKAQLQELKDTPEVRDFIISLLGEGPRLSEATQLSANYPTKIVSEDGTETIRPVDVSSKYFDPAKDEWEIVGIEENESQQYRIQIEAVKNRSFIGPAYVMDTFWTTWFSLTGN